MRRFDHISWEEKMAEEKTLFLRKASGLVRGWDMFDVMAFQSYAQPFNLATYIVSLSVFWPESNLIIAIVLMLIFETFHCLYYTGLIPTMPRVGGDYVWQTRVLNPALGFFIIFPGWLLCLPMWITLNNIAYCQQLIAPMFLLFGDVNTAAFFLTGTGLFAVTLFNLIYSFITCGFGLKLYAWVQKPTYILALIGLLAANFVFFAYGDPNVFEGNFNRFYHDVLGYETMTAYEDTLNAAAEGGLALSLNWDVVKATPLIPLIVFYGLWPVWGAPMYGEVRGSTSVWKTFMSMMMANLPLNILAILVFTGAWKTVRYEFFQAWNWGWWGGGGPGSLMPPSVPFYVYFVTGSAALTLFILFFNTWAWLHTNGAGNGYLVVTRMMFAMSFDRLLPSWFATLSTRYRVPLFSMIWTAALAALLGYLYSFNIGGFSVLFLDATLVLLLGFCITAIVAIVLPYRNPDLWKASPASKYGPLFSISAIIFLGYALMIFYYWIADPLYGVNNPVSAVFLGCIYIAGLIIYFAFKYYRKSQGIDISKIFKEVPVE